MSWSEAAHRNQQPIAQQLDTIFESHSQWRILEIGSGTGQHAVHFTSVMPQLTWQTSDLAVNHAAILSNIDGNDRVIPPLEIDAESLGEISQLFDAVYTANTCHIMSWANVQLLIGNVGALLQLDGLFVIYGPFNTAGRATSESNYRFDQYLSQVRPHQGLRNREDIAWAADTHGLSLWRCVAMPANNQLLVFKKRRQ